MIKIQTSNIKKLYKRYLIDCERKYIQPMEYDIFVDGYHEFQGTEKY